VIQRFKNLECFRWVAYKRIYKHLFLEINLKLMIKLKKPVNDPLQGFRFLWILKIIFICM